MKQMDCEALFEAFSQVKVGVIGDVMLDTYWWGHVERISPEAPVPIVAVDKKEARIGGAGNVALNLVSLGAKATILSVIGEDEDGVLLKGLFQKKGIDIRYLQSDPHRCTTNKIRIISRNQQMMRLDAEVAHDLNEDLAVDFIKRVETYLDNEDPQVIIFEDYNKGVLTSSVIEQVIALCKARRILTTVDPKKKNFFSYQGVDIFKPNLKEVRDALQLSSDKVDLSYMQKIHDALQKQLKHHISFITLSERGVFFQGNQTGEMIPCHVRNIADVSGAGDTVIAVASLVYAITKDMRLMAEMANLAGGLVCEEVGTAAIQKDRLFQECKLLHFPS